MRPQLLAVLLFLLVMCFGVLIFGGYLINRDKPPIPKVVMSDTGTVLFTGADIDAGQNYYFSRGGQHIGSIWGHGSYLAPDWSADYLHRLGLYTAARRLGLDPEKAKAFTQKDFDSLGGAKKAELGVVVTEEIRKNRYDPSKGELVYTNHQAEAFVYLAHYYSELFQKGNDRMGLQPGIARNEKDGFLIASFFSWLAWAAGTERPGSAVTYTTNWPYDPLVGNHPTPDMIIWSIVSVVILILVLGLVLFLYNRYIREDDYSATLVPLQEPAPSASQKATIAYFIVAALLFLAQISVGSLTAHYTVEGTSFFGLPIAKLLPYAVLRTWHLQLAIFWIATCFLAAGLFIAPFVGKEPKHQGKLVIILFAAVVVVVLGTLSGTWLSIQGFFGGEGYYLGHQGYEYIELGRVWQLLLIAGMLIWLVLVLRAILPALKNEKDKGGLTHLLLYSSIAIPLFYMAGLMYGKGSHLSDAEYWRWWVVHLWVEGFFEVFATVVFAFLLTRIGAVSEKLAHTTVYLVVTLYLGSGIVGTFHHVYWAGTPAPIMALGGVFSALEVVPLTLLGFEVARNMRVIETAGPRYEYRWPLYFFIAVAFWNLVGAGVFGFLINPPIVLYYIQGINTTPIHAHTALFGVYGLLAIALMLFSVRHIFRKDAWSDSLLKWCFWGLNGGIFLMTVISLIPSGFYQFYHAVNKGMWYARSPEIASGDFIRTVSWLRMGPDIIFVLGAFCLLAFLARGIWRSFIKK
ncbi:MAG TPA: nitric-oxide reductase large subunit [Spirochaetota bacterium]|nr:nitric-oxide reductase large subunit [Spirochaetota bacterium]